MKTKSTIAGITLLAGLAGGGTIAVDRAQDPYLDRADHYELPVTADIAQNDHLEVAKANPSVTLSRWNDEVRITITPNLPGAGKASNASRPLLSKRMGFTKNGITAFVEPSATSSDFDIDFTLESQPASNAFTYTFTNAENLDFFYQPALDGEEGNGRPENVVGSYAVYSKSRHDHVSGQTDYGTGKLFHIYRPKALDAVGNEVWADLSYSDGILSVTVPEKFLATATYPVTVDPTFGYTSIGASTLGPSFPNTASLYMGSKFTTPSDMGTADSISIAGHSNFGILSVTGYIHQTDGTAIDNVNLTESTSAAFYSASFASPHTLSANTDYFLGQWAAATHYNYYDTGAANQGAQQASYSGSGNLGTLTSGTQKWSIYITYTAGGGGGGGGADSTQSDAILFE